MKSFFNRLTSNWNFAALFLGFMAWVCYLVARKNGNPLWWGALAVFVLVTVGLVMRKQWARWIGIALLSCLLMVKVNGLIRNEFAWKTLFHAGAIAFVGYGLWKKPDEWILDDFAEEPEDIAEEE